MATPNEDNGSIGFILDEKSVPSVEIQEEPEEQGRDRWSRKIEFLFACIGFCVGYGNMWRFPYMCFKNGGGMGLFIQSINKAINQSINQSIDRSIKQSINQPINQSINRSNNQPTNQSSNRLFSLSINPSIHPSIHPINQSINQTINQSIKQTIFPIK